MNKYNIVYDFSKVEYKYKEDITFENIMSGTFNICGSVLDASKIIGFDYKYNDEESTLTIELDTSKWDFRLKKEVLFGYQLNVNDSSVTIQCGSLYTLDIGKTYDIYLTVPNPPNCYMKSCIDGLPSCVIQDSSSTNRFYQNFQINSNFTNSSLGVETVDTCTGTGVGTVSNIVLLYGDDGCTILESGKTQTITVNSDSLNVTYTYSKTPGVNIWTAYECQGNNNSISDYKVGSIIFNSAS